MVYREKRHKFLRLSSKFKARVEAVCIEELVRTIYNYRESLRSKKRTIINGERHNFQQYRSTSSHSIRDSWVIVYTPASKSYRVPLRGEEEEEDSLSILFNANTRDVRGEISRPSVCSL